MFESARQMVLTSWLVVGVVWLLTAFRLKPIVSQPKSGTRMWEILALVCGAALLFSESPHWALLDGRFIARVTEIVDLGVMLTVCGAGFAILARIHLGRNWSAAAAIKHGHELVCSGPYRLVRHPIYTGALVAAIGTALAFGEERDLLALPLIVLGFWLKARSEEHLLMSSFGDRYADYRRRVRGAIIPYVL